MNNSKLTAAEEVLLAAVALTKKSKKEFTEWQLTVETWSLNKNRWGLRGFEEKYPDHKRVMNEVMAKGTQKVVGKGWVEKIRPNYYRLTSAGIAKSLSLSDNTSKSQTRSIYEYEALAPYINSPVFESHCKDSNEPKTWLGAAAFLDLKNYTYDTLERKMKTIKDSINSCLKWMEENNQQILIRSDSSEYRPITKERLRKLELFLKFLEDKFRPQFDAIRSKKN